MTNDFGIKTSGAIDKIKGFIKASVYKLTAFIVAMVHLTSAIIVTGLTGKSIWQIIADTVIILLLGMAIDSLCRAQGISDGRKEKNVISSEERYEGLLKKVQPFFYALNTFCNKKNKEALKTARTRILMELDYPYEDFFTEEGYIKPFLEIEGEEKKSRKRRYRAYKKVKRHRITMLTVPLLVSDYHNDKDPNAMGRSIAQFMTAKGRTDFASKIMIAVFFGFFGAELASDFTMAKLVWTLMETTLLLAIGIIKYIIGHYYVIYEYRRRVDFKSNLLEEFTAEQENEHNNEPEGGQKNVID